MHHVQRHAFATMLIVFWCGICVQAGQIALSSPGDEAPRRGFARPPLHVAFAAATAPSGGVAPWKIRRAYGLSSVASQGSGQTIAIIEAYDDPNIEADLALFNAHYALRACTKANGCLRKVYAAGTKPRTDPGWSVEIALDVEWTHAIAPYAQILLVEAPSNHLSDLLRAVDVAVINGASVVSMSWGSPEFSSETSSDRHFAVNGVTFVAAAGDVGHGVEYPAVSPYVVGIGGTVLTTDASGNYVREKAWPYSSGGSSAYEVEPSFQSSLPTPVAAGRRGTPDVAYAAAGFPVYDSVSYNGFAGWFIAAGTSAGAPQWAAIIGIANSLRRTHGKAPLNHPLLALYAGARFDYAGNYHDISSGSNGTCGTQCVSGARYDYVTGLGSPRAPGLILFLASQ